jgi:hypothetical protein
MTSLKELMEIKPKHMKVRDIAKEVIENIELFQVTHISSKKIQAAYDINRDKAAVVIASVEMLKKN